MSEKTLEQLREVVQELTEIAEAMETEKQLSHARECAAAARVELAENILTLFSVVEPITERNKWQHFKEGCPWETTIGNNCNGNKLCLCEEETCAPYHFIKRMP